MKKPSSIVLPLLLVASFTATSGCERAADPGGPASTGTQLPAAATSPAWPPIVVHKSPSCGCCGLWVEHLRQAGFEVDVRDSDDLRPIKEYFGVPAAKASCHTAEVGDYFVEGHVPADDIKRLLRQKPDARGLVLPGMPIGSPGMEVPDGRTQPYAVELVNRDGSTHVFAQH